MEGVALDPGPRAADSRVQTPDRGTSVGPGSGVGVTSRRRWPWVGSLLLIVGLGSACAGGRSSSIPPSVPDEPLAKLAQANEYLTKGQCDRAVNLYREVIPRVESQPGIAPYQVAELYYYLGMAYLCQKDTDAAVTHFQKALALEPLYYPARNALAIAYVEKNLLDDAERIWLELLKVPDYPPAAVYFNLTRLYIRQDKWTKALFTARKAVDLAPDELGPRLLFAQILEHLNMVPDAIGQYRTIVEKWPQNLESVYRLAQLYEKTGELCEAKRLYFRILELDPVGPHADQVAAKAHTLPCDRPVLVTPPKPAEKKPPR